jgi:hypothetical protein
LALTLGGVFGAGLATSAGTEASMIADSYDGGIANGVGLPTLPRAIST